MPLLKQGSSGPNVDALQPRLKPGSHGLDVFTQAFNIGKKSIVVAL
jgi:hypothetical protein